MAALAAMMILTRGPRLVNRISSDVGIGEFVQFVPVEGDALLADRELPDVRPDGVIELRAAHAQVCRGLCRADESRQDVGHMNSVSWKQTADQGCGCLELVVKSHTEAIPSATERKSR